MDRRAVIRAISSALVFAAPVAVRAQTEKAVRRIGFLASGAPFPPAVLEQQYAPLRELGWIEGRNLLVERRYTYDRPALLQTYAEELVRLKVDLIVTDGTDATVAAKNATKTIPIVIRWATDPVQTGIVASLSRPGGNITGYCAVGIAVEEKLLTLLRELMPNLQRAGRLEASTNLGYRAVLGDLQRAYRSIQIEPVFLEITRGSEVEDAILEMMRRRAQALVVGGAPMIYDARAEITGIALKHALPTFGGSRAFVEAGALMSYHDSVDELRRRGAAFIDRILRGANPGDLPIERPTRFELGINLNAAKALRIAVPQSLIVRADYVLQ